VTSKTKISVKIRQKKFSLLTTSKSCLDGFKNMKQPNRENTDNIIFTGVINIRRYKKIFDQIYMRPTWLLSGIRKISNQVNLGIVTSI
jgi:hypothetical protein